MSLPDPARRARVRALGAVLLVASLVTLHCVVRGRTWTSPVLLRLILEALATLLAFIVGGLALVRYYTRRRHSILAVGAGFLGTALLDLLLALTSSPAPPEPVRRLMTGFGSWAWNASRMFLALLLFLSWLVRKQEQHGAGPGRGTEWRRIRDGWVFAAVAVMTAGSLLLIAFVPPPVYPGPMGALQRPRELPAAALFGATAVLYAAGGRWRTDAFEYGLGLSLVAACGAQGLFMAFSARPDDAMAIAAHAVKFAGYVFVLTGLPLSLRDLVHEADRSARHDALTGLPNRTAFREEFDRLRALARHTPGPHSVAILDLDRFKSVNDTHGHATGDEVLRRTAVVVARSLRECDTVARWGGEEFVALFPSTAPAGAAQALTKALQALGEERFAGAGGVEFRVTFSAGVAEAGADLPLEAVVEAADRLLYAAKAAGRCRIFCADGAGPPPGAH